MATIDFSSVTETTQQSSGATYVVTLPASGTYAVGDLLMIFLYNSSGGTTISQNGGTDWTVVTGQTQTTNIRTAVIYKKAGSTTETNPTFNIANNTVNAVSWVVKNVDATTQVEASSIATAGSATSVASATATSLSENALAIFCGGHSSTTAQLRFKSSQATALNANVNLFANRSTLVGFKQLGASSTTPSATLYTTTTALNLQLWTIIIKNSSGGATMPWADSGLNELVWYGIHGSPSQSITNQAPSNFAGGVSINSIATSTAAPTMDVNSTSLDWGYYTGYSSTENFASPPTSKWVGNYHAFTFPDLTGKIISFEWKSRQSPVTSTQVASDGHIVGFTDGTNYAVYQIAPKTVGGWVMDQWERITIEPGVTSTYATSGSINWAAVTGILYATHSASGSGGARECHVKNLVVFDKATIVGGGASYPATWEAAYRALTSCGFYKIARKQAASQYQFDCSVQIGDGSIATYFMPSPQAFEMAPPYNSKTQPWWRVAADKISLTIKAKASDTINLSASSLVTTQSALLSLDAASSTTANYNLQSLLVVGFNVTWSAAEDLTGATFKSGKTVNIAGAGIWTDAIVNATTSANASISVTADGHVFNGQTIDGTGALYALELGASVKAITLTDCPITAGSADKILVKYPDTTVAATAIVQDRYYKIKTAGTTTWTSFGAANNNVGTKFKATRAGTVADGTGDAYAGVVVTISGSTSLADTDITLDTGITNTPVLIDSPAVNQKVTVSGITVGARVQIYDTTNNTELFNGTATGGDTVVTGDTVVWTDPLSATANRAIRIRVAYVSGVTAKNFIETSGLTCGQTSGTAEITYPVSPTDDTTYNTNGISGSGVTGVTFVDSGTNDRIDCNIAGGSVSLPSIYAAFVYWNFTATGIANDFTYVDAPDTANYILSGMKIRNTSATPLKITGGYFYDSTGSVENCVDTAGSTGNIFPMPAHVVPYATGSGVTAQDVSDIAAAVAASTPAAVWLESKALTVSKFLGLK